MIYGRGLVVLRSLPLSETEIWLVGWLRGSQLAGWLRGSQLAGWLTEILLVHCLSDSFKNQYRYDLSER